MIVNINDLLKDNKVVLQFNINNLEWTRYILEECANLDVPVILGVSEKTVAYMGGYKLVVDIIKDLINELDIKIPIVIHLDHGTSFGSCKKAIDSGFTSVMIDGSKYDLEENIKTTKKVVEYAKNVSVEAEIGQILNNDRSVSYTEIDDALLFVEKTNVDLLAPSLGNLHGIYKRKPNLDFSRMKILASHVSLALHGGSGLSQEDLLKSVECGVRKINFNTDLQIAWSEGVKNYLRNSNEYDPRKIISAGEQALKEKIREKLQVVKNVEVNK